jgi:hypothetical protein
MLFTKEIPEKEKLQYDEDNKQFYNNYHPYPFTPPRHAAEAVIVKTNNPVYGRYY